MYVFQCSIISSFVFTRSLYFMAPSPLLVPRSWPYPLVPVPTLALALNLYLPAKAQICNLCDLSLGSLEDISPAQIYRADLNSVVFFLLSFVAIYSLNETYFSILVFSDPILFSLFLFLCSVFPVFYFLSFSSVLLCIFSTFSLLLLSLSSTFFLAAFYLSPLTFLVYHLVFSFCFYLFLCLLLSFLDFFYFHSLPVFYYIPLTIFFIFLRIRVFFYYYHFYPSVLLFCIFYLSIFCLPFLLIFLHNGHLVSLLFLFLHNEHLVFLNQFCLVYPDFYGI